MADVFISHASEDEEEVARPIADALIASGFEVWYDKYALRLGDSLLQEIDRGLSGCRYGVVILSPSFFAKEWPRRELDGLVARETNECSKRILPIWHHVSKDMVAGYSPTLAARLAVSTEKGIGVIVNEISKVLSDRARSGDIDQLKSQAIVHTPHPGRNFNVPPGYERRLNYLRFKVARESAARNDEGGYKYPVHMLGTAAQMQIFAAMAKLERVEFLENDGQIELKFEYSGEIPPDDLQDMAVKYGVTIKKCGPTIIMELG